MKNKWKKLGILLMIGVLIISGCAQATDSTPDPAAGTSLPVNDDAAKAMQLARSIDGIVSISLKDLDGNAVARVFSADELLAIQQAFNESFIMDTAYIEMIAGNTMTIMLEDGREVFIHSYGDENYIVARIGDITYHLGCQVIGKILLEKSK